MNKLYNNQDDITSGFENFFKSVVPNIRKTQTNIIPAIIFGMIKAESIVSSDIAKVLKNNFFNVKFDSIVKRINRFFNNNLFDPYYFYHHIISNVLANYKKKHKDKRVHIIFDHTFCHENYTVFMITMRIGKQGIPLWFKCFKNISDNDAFKVHTLIDGINAVHNLFKNTDFKLIFLADRWFCSTFLLRHIDSLGHSYCIRLKKNINVFYLDKKEKHYITKKAGDLIYHKCNSVKYNDVYITDDYFKTNLVFSDCINTDEPWIIITNDNPNRAIKDYSYRFGAIECVFKHQKSNGFNLEKISNAKLKAFSTMYTLVCVGVLYLTILGADYSKNSKCYKNEKITTHKSYLKNGKRIKLRVMSLFNTGLTLFNRAFNSIKYIRLPFSFKLYDI